MADRQVHQEPESAAEFFSTLVSSASGDAERDAMKQLEQAPWAKLLLANLDNARKSGDRRQERAYLWEVRVALAIDGLGWPVQYEFKTGEGEQSIDFRVMSRPELLIETIAVQNSVASERAGWVEEPASGLTVFGISLASTNRDQRETTAGEMVRVVELLTRKASKFPPIRSGVYHVVLADIRGFNAGCVDLDDCDQIAWGPTAVNDYARQFFGTTPVHGVFDPANLRPEAVRCRERLHAVGLCFRQRSESENVLTTRRSVYRANPSLITTKEEGDLIASILDRSSVGE